MFDYSEDRPLVDGWNRSFFPIYFDLYFSLFSSRVILPSHCSYFEVVYQRNEGDNEWHQVKLDVSNRFLELGGIQHASISLVSTIDEMIQIFLRSGTAACPVKEQLDSLLFYFQVESI